MNERVPLAIDLTFDITIPFSMIETDCGKHSVLLTFSSNALVCAAMGFLSFIHHIEITPKHIYCTLIQFLNSIRKQLTFRDATISFSAK